MSFHSSSATQLQGIRQGQRNVSAVKQQPSGKTSTGPTTPRSNNSKTSDPPDKPTVPKLGNVISYPPIQVNKSTMNLNLNVEDVIPEKQPRQIIYPQMTRASKLRAEKIADSSAKLEQVETDNPFPSARTPLNSSMAKKTEKDRVSFKKPRASLLA
jgi:hypothetical protein